MLWLLLACEGPTGEPGPKGEPGLTGPDGSVGEGAGDLQTLDEDTSWSADIDVAGIVYVPKGVTLTIEPGTTVSLLPTSGIFVDGALIADGVTFELAFGLSAGVDNVNVAGKGDRSSFDDTVWRGVNLRLEGEAADGISGAEFEDATLHLYSRATPFVIEDHYAHDLVRDFHNAINARDMAEVRVKNSTFEDHWTAIYFSGLDDGATLVVKDSTFERGGTAINAGNGRARDQVFHISGVTISDMASYGILVYRGAFTIDDVAISGTNSAGIYTDSHCTGSVTNSTVHDTGGIGIQMNGDGFTVDNVQITDTAAQGLWGKEDMTATNVTVTGSGSTCIDFNGSNSLGQNLTVSDCFYDGVEMTGGTLSQFDVSDVGDDCVGGVSDVITISDATFDGCDGHGVEASSAPTVRDITMSNIGGSGTSSVGGVFEDLTITAPGAYGIQAGAGDIDVSNVVVSSPKNQGVYTLGDAVVDDLTVTNSTSFCLDLRGFTNVVTDVTLTGCVSYGIYTQHIDLQRCVISQSTHEGIYVYGTGADSVIRDCDITDSGRWGVRGSGNRAVDVYDNNITNSVDYGIYYARQISGNHLADNKGQTGVDSSVGGVLDGVYDYTSAQQVGADLLELPATDPLTTTGPQ